MIQRVIIGKFKKGSQQRSGTAFRCLHAVSRMQICKADLSTDLTVETVAGKLACCQVKLFKLAPQIKSGAFLAVQIDVDDSRRISAIYNL